MQIGFSTGALYGSRDDWDLCIPAAAALSCQTVELACGMGRLPRLVKYLERNPDALDRFDYVGLHVPDREPEWGWEQTVAWLSDIPSQTVLFHPDQLPDLELLRSLGPRAAIENMDHLKSFGSSVEDLHSVLNELPQARVVIDVAHARAIDPSGSLLSELVEAFATRLAHLHLSQIDRQGRHHGLPLSELHILEGIPKAARAVPWIWEEMPCF